MSRCRRCGQDVDKTAECELEIAALRLEVRRLKIIVSVSGERIRELTSAIEIIPARVEAN